MLYEEIELPVLMAGKGQSTAADALVSANVILRGGLFAEGKHRNVAMFMDLCNLIEASILHERLVCLPTNVPSGTGLLPVIRTLKQEGVLWKLEYGASDFLSQAAISVLDYIPNITVSEAKNLLLASIGKTLPLFKSDAVKDAFDTMKIQENCLAAYPHIGMKSDASDADDLTYRFRRSVSYLSVANCLNAAYFPNFNRLAIVNPILRHSLRNVRVNFIQRANEEIKKYIGAQKERLRIAGREVDISIPPLVAVVFDKARRKKSLQEAILQSREEFVPVRQRFSKYAHIAASNDYPLEESLSALDVLERDLQTISATAGKRSCLRMLEWRPVATFVASAVDNSAEMASVKSWTDLAIKLLKMPINALKSYIRQRRVQPILDIPEKVGRISSLSELTADLFSWCPSKEELVGLKKFSRVVTASSNGCLSEKS
jgi:hypothetical protein